MSSSKLLNYPFTFTSTVSLRLKPFSDIEDPDNVVIELLDAGYDMVCSRENTVENPDKLTLKAIKKLEEINLYLKEDADKKKIKIIQAPKNIDREEPYICEITYEGGFVYGTKPNFELVEKIIEIGVINKKGDLDSVLSDFVDATGNNYYEYKDTLTRAYHSMEVIKGVFNISEPIIYEK